MESIINEIFEVEDYEDMENDNTLEIEPKGTIRKRPYITERVPFMTDSCGNYIGIDYKPSSKGIIGQIINYGRDELKMVVLANSFKDFAQGLEISVSLVRFTFEAPLKDSST